MGMTGAEGAMIAAMLGSSVLGGIMAPEGQELTSFEGIPGADPAVMFGEAKGQIGDYLGALLKLAGEPVTLNTSVAPLPAFRGGSLPMSIAAPAQDPNRTNVSRRSVPGVEIPRRTLSEVDPTPGAFRRRTPNSTDTGRSPRPRERPAVPRGSVPAGGTPAQGGGDELPGPEQPSGRAVPRGGDRIGTGMPRPDYMSDEPGGQGRGDPAASAELLLSLGDPSQQVQDVAPVGQRLARRRLGA
jgi:hypothetical protein